MALLLGLSLLSLASAYLTVSVTDYGAVGDNATDNTAAFLAATRAVAAAAGGEVVVPAGVFQTGPFNLSSNMCLTVQGTVFGVANASAFPRVQTPPSYLSSFPAWRHHPFVWAPNATNVTIRGSGVLNGGGPYWWSGPERTQETRPHLLELHNVTGAEVTGIQLQNSAFWTFRPIYCSDVWIHDMSIQETYGAGDNTDGMDVDSSHNVVVERCNITCGDGELGCAPPLPCPRPAGHFSLFSHTCPSPPPHTR
jgi:polygalacturonase